MQKIRIGVNTRFLLPSKLEGFGWYTFEVTKRIVENNPDVDFYFFFDRKYDSKYIFSKNVIPIVLPPQARHPILYRIWFDWSISYALKKYKIDFFFSPDGYLSLRTKTPQIGVIHDINFEHFPKDLPKKDANYLQKYFPLFAKKAKKILTVSHFSKEDIINKYGIDSEKIIVSYNGINESFKPLSTQEKENTKAKYSKGKEYILFVGSIHPRKNLKRLLLAFDQYKAESSEIQLLVVGDKYWWNNDLKSTYENLQFKDSIHFTGHVNQQELTQITGSATLLAYISYFEGFGLPVGEAMKSGTAVLGANKTSIPEVGGNAIHYCDPFSVEDIALGIKRIHQDKEYRLELIQKGYEQVKQFNWDNTAKEVWQTIQAELEP